MQAAAQGQLASVGLYRLNGATATPLSLNAAQSIAVDPQNPMTLYVATPQGTAMKSLDGGNTWSTLNVSSSPVLTIAVDPSNSQNLYAGTGAGVVKSTNGGATWPAISSGISGSVTQIWIDPNNLRWCWR